MIRLRTVLLAAAVAIPAAPALAADTDAGRARFAPVELGESDKRAWRDAFAAIRAGNWIGAAERIDRVPDGPLKQAALAELYLAKGSPRVELPQLLDFLQKAPEHPKADQIARLATTRGATSLPSLPEAQSLVWQGGQPRRSRAQATRGDDAADALGALIQPLIVDNRPDEAERLFRDHESRLSRDARTEFEQRIGWSYYIVGNDRDARRLSEDAARGSGEWAIHGAWSAGLAAWRMKDCRAASAAFAKVAGRSGDMELVAAGNYWAARADMMCNQPKFVQARLRSAARHKETFYGMLAATALGIRAPEFAGFHDYRDAEWRGVAGKPNVRTAIALAQIGEDELAGDFLRHQARIGRPAEHDALLHLAADLNLTATQYWLAHHAPRGASVNAAARYPRPDWRPARGWRVDPSLAFAHALQESDFRPTVVSPAGAVGLMQVRPGTAGDIARKRGEAFDSSRLKDPAVNMEFGQSYIEYLRDMGATGGLLPKVIAAYNAGPAPVIEWNARGFDKGDPLLYIESIPYWETRGYVPIVLRNYWVYEQTGGKGSASREALAQGMWPRFPGLRGATAVRMDAPATAGGAAYSTLQAD